MSKIFFIILFFANLDSAFAAGTCDSARDAALKDCAEANVKDPKRLVEQMRALTNQTDVGIVSGLEQNIPAGQMAQQQLGTFAIKCAESFTNCQRVCQQTAAQEQANMNPEGVQAAQEANKQCSEEPVQNHAAAEKAKMDLSQILPALISLLGQLKGDSGETGDACAKDPAQCKVDTATDTPGATLANTTRSAGEGSFLDAGLNTNDAPPMGEKVDPSMAQFGQAPGGGGGGFGGGGSGGGPGGRGRGVAEVNADGTPKINFGATGGGAGGKNGGMQMGASSINKGGGNPVASRVGIDDGSKGGNGVSNAVDKALQARGLASGQPGGISAAHAFDNFQKIEKRIQTERNKLAEL